MSSCKFPEERRLNVSTGYISIDANLKLKAKEIVSSFISAQEETELSYDFDTNTSSEADTTNDSTWKEKSQKIQNNLIKKISNLKRQISINQEHISQKRETLINFIKLARTNSLLAADLLHECKGGVVNGRNQWIKKPKIKCCKMTDGQQCSQTALLYSRYCLGHITNDSSQVLYKPCVAIDSEKMTKCNKPVLEILQDKTYCLKHMSESKKTVKLPVSSSSTSGSASSKGTLSQSSVKSRKTSPKLQKIKVQQENTKKSLPISSLPLHPPSTSFLPSPINVGWNLTDNEGERNNRPSGLSSPTKDILPSNQSNTLSPFSLAPPTLPPPLPTPVLLLPPDPTPGSFLDDDTSSDEGI